MKQQNKNIKKYIIIKIIRIIIIKNMVIEWLKHGYRRVKTWL